MSPGIPAALSFLLVIAILTAGCVGSQDSSSAAAPPPGQQPAPAGIALPENRPFFMGFTPMPYDATGQAVRDTYNFTGEHGDIILHHFDQGVPGPRLWATPPTAGSSSLKQTSVPASGVKVRKCTLP